MSRNRTQRRQRKRPHRRPAVTIPHGDGWSQMRRTYEKLFRRLGMAELWERLPKRLREELYRVLPIRSEVKMTRRARESDRARVAAEMITTILDDEKRGLSCGSGTVSLRQALGLVRPVADLAVEDLAEQDGGLSSELMEALRTCAPLADKDGVTEVLGMVYAGLFLLCDLVNNFDEPYVVIEDTIINRSHERLWRFTIDAVPPQKRRFVVDGTARTAYRVGEVQSLAGVTWVDMPGDRFGLPAGDVPVYVQSHAMHRIRERLEIKTHRQLVNTMIVNTCEAARIVQRDGDTFWLEVQTGSTKRLGYLIVSRQEDALLIRTFTFLTASNGPEARKLRKLLADAGYSFNKLKLGELSTFVLGEVPDDPQLRRILEESGCGHLLKLAEQEAAADGDSQTDGE